MIKSKFELEATLERIRYLQQQVERLHEVETNPHNYRLSVGGFLSEIDRMKSEVGNHFTTGYGNYTEERRELYRGMSVENIVAEMEQFRKM